MHRVIKRFVDLQDGRHAYNPGDQFPREGLDVSKERLDELASDKNRRGMPLIEFVPEAEQPKRKYRKRKNHIEQEEE